MVPMVYFVKIIINIVPKNKEMVTLMIIYLCWTKYGIVVIFFIDFLRQKVKMYTPNALRTKEDMSTSRGGGALVK